MLVRNQNRRIARNAFTLMEMMVVVAIIVVLGGIAVVAMQTFSDRGNEAKAAAAVKQIDEAVFYYQLEHKTYPPSLEALTQPDIFGKTYLKMEALVAPWAGAQYQVDANGPRNHALNQEKPDIFIVHPSGKYMWGNWATGKLAMGS